jgi:hypothetical protein
MNRPVSLLVAILCSGILVSTVLSRPLQGTLNWDVTGYYFYLPATFIFDDLALRDPSRMEDMRVKYDLSGTLYQFHPVDGRQTNVDQYTCGLAVCYAPAFFIAHTMAPYVGDPQDGFSPVYQTSVAVWSLLIAIAGLFALRKLLNLFFPDRLAAVVLILIFAATNYFIQIPRGLAGPHNYLFLLYAVFLIAVVKWHRAFEMRYALLMACAFGLACLIRPTEIFALVIPVFWGCGNWGELPSKWRRLWSEHRRQLIACGAVLFTCALPQMVYWMLVAGRPLYMSYSNPGEGLDWLSPHTLSFLFSFRKGWFVYTPLMALALFGFISLWHQRRDLFLAILLFFLLNLYIVSSWSTWWYAQCFSQRAMVHTLPVMAILLGFAFKWFFSGTLRKYIGMAITMCVVVLTVFFQWQYEKGILHHDRMTGAYFRAVFGRTEVSESAKELLLIERPFDGSMVFANQDRYHLTESYRLSGLFPDEFTAMAVKDSVQYSSIRLHAEHAFTPAIRNEFSRLTSIDHVWLKVRADVWLPSVAQPDDCLLVVTADHSGGVYGYRAEGVVPEKLKPGAWNVLTLDYLTPEVRSVSDPISVYLWYRAAGEVYCREIEVGVFEKK